MGAVTQIEHIELNSTQSSVTFSSITSDYDDLMILLSARSDDTASGLVFDPLLYRLNSSTTGYSARQQYGNGSSAGTSTETTDTSTDATGTWGRFTLSGINNSNSTSNTFSSVSLYLPNYASANNKSISLDYVHENNATLAYQEIVAGLWSDTAAINSISFALKRGSFVQYSSATLYGITAGSDGTTIVS